MLTAIDWTAVLVVGVPAYIASIGAAVAAIYAIKIRHDVQTPSGDSLGAVAERTHDIAHANAALAQETVATVRRIDGHTCHE
jgi:hypothetical protein